MAEAIKIDKALAELKENNKKKFNQSIELIVNLKKFDPRKTSVNFFTQLPHETKDKKICGFIEGSSKLIETIPKKNFPLYKNKKKVKKLVEEYDFFIASGPNMPGVATTFGKVLGPAGKMPSPKMGILMQENEDAIKELVEKINKSVRIHAKEPSIKIVIGKEEMDEKKVIENIKSAYNSILNELPLGKDNVKNVLIKLTMSPAKKIEV